MLKTVGSDELAGQKNPPGQSCSETLYRLELGPDEISKLPYESKINPLAVILTPGRALTVPPGVTIRIRPSPINKFAPSPTNKFPFISSARLLIPSKLAAVPTPFTYPVFLPANVLTKPRGDIFRISTGGLPSATYKNPASSPTILKGISNVADVPNPSVDEENWVVLPASEVTTPLEDILRIRPFPESATNTSPVLSTNKPRG